MKNSDKSIEQIEADKARLYEVMYRHGITLPELAEKLGITYRGLTATISRGVSRKMAARIAAVLNEPIRNILPPEDDGIKFSYYCPSCGAEHTITIR